MLKLSGGVEVSILVAKARAYVYARVTADVAFKSINGDPYITFEEIATLVRINGVVKALSYRLQVDVGWNVVVELCYLFGCSKVLEWPGEENPVWSMTLGHEPITVKPVMSGGKIDANALTAYPSGQKRDILAGNAVLVVRPQSVSWYPEGISLSLNDNIEPNVRECGGTCSPLTVPYKPGIPFENHGATYLITASFDSSNLVKIFLSRFEYPNAISISTTQTFIATGSRMLFSNCQRLEFVDPSVSAAYAITGTPCPVKIEGPHGVDIVFSGSMSSFSSSKSITVDPSIGAFNSTVPATKYFSSPLLKYNVL